MARLKWGGIRGKGIKLKSDLGMSVAALFMATAVVILAYFVFERSSVQIYTNRTIPTVEVADKTLERADKIWDADLLTKTADPLTNETNPVSMRNEAIAWDRQLKSDAKAIRSAKVTFVAQPTPPNATLALDAEVSSYLSATDVYVSDAASMVIYLNQLIESEMAMNEAIRAVPYIGLVSPAALHQRDATIGGELAKIEKLVPPPSLQVFHDDTTRFLADYLTVQRQTTTAYETGAGLTRLEALGAEGETVIHTARDRLQSDVRTLKTGILGRDSQRARMHKKLTYDEIDRLRNKYHF
jgi:hypothetical protein